MHEIPSSGTFRVFVRRVEVKLQVWGSPYTADGYVQDIVNNGFVSDAGISGVSVKTPTSYNFNTQGIGYDDFKLCSCVQYGSIADVCGTTIGDGLDSNTAMYNLLDGMQLQHKI